MQRDFLGVRVPLSLEKRIYYLWSPPQLSLRLPGSCSHALRSDLLQGPLLRVPFLVVNISTGTVLRRKGQQVRKFRPRVKSPLPSALQTVLSPASEPLHLSLSAPPAWTPRPQSSFFWGPLMQAMGWG